MNKKLITIAIALGVILLSLALCLCVFIFITPAVKAPGSNQPVNDLSISLERGACFGACPVYKVTVDRDGNATFFGERFVQVTGEIKYKLDSDKLQQLITAVQAAEFFSLQDRYENTRARDLPSFTITVTTEGKTKQIYAYGLSEDIPQKLQDLAKQIDEITQTNQWTKK